MQLLQALVAANSLCGGADPESDYVRGQAELIVNLFGLSADDRSDVILLIAGYVKVR